MSAPESRPKSPGGKSKKKARDASTPEAEESQAAGVEAEAEAGAPQAEPEPEPWTPERVLSWNSYYDIYVVGGVLLLIFFASANKIANSSIWTMLQTGKMIVANAAPVVTDPYSSTMAGKPWVNVSWVFQAAMSQLYEWGRGMAPANPDRVAQAARAEQYAAGALVLVTALIRVLTALILLRIRHLGPGLWWSALCVMLALGVSLSPLGVSLGGMAGQSQVSPDAWGLLFLAIELWLLHKALNLGQSGSLYGLVPLFLLWANSDESFAFGLVILLAALLPSSRLVLNAEETEFAHEPSTPRFFPRVAILVACVAVCLANPSLHRIFFVGFEPFWGWINPVAKQLVFSEISLLNSASYDLLKEEYFALLAFYLVVVGLGVASFALNRARFSASRFSLFLVAAAVWAVAIYRFMGEFALVWASILVLNGQEWYQSRFGLEGRLGWKWTFWSTGGRAITIVLVFAALIIKGLIGWGRLPGESTLGFGVSSERFSFDAAEFLRSAPIKGQVLNSTAAQGDALIWKAYPLRKTFVDGRTQLFSRELRGEWQTMREAIRDDKPEVWKPLLDQYGISVVMVPMGVSTALENPSINTYTRLMSSSNWVPFYDDGNVVMFGRSDAEADDLAYFQGNRLDADSLAYLKPRTVPPPQRPPSPVGWLDKIFPSRTLLATHPRVEAARRWLVPITERSGETTESPAPIMSDPAHCLLAIQDARIALASKPDDALAWRILHTAYRNLAQQETALLDGIELTPENRDQIAGLVPESGLRLRYQQQAAALNYAIQTTPPPVTIDGKEDLANLHFQLALLYQTRNFLDLTRDNLQSYIDLMPPEEIQEGLADQILSMGESVDQVRQRMDDAAIDQNARPYDLAMIALSNGAPGLALEELRKAQELNENIAQVRPSLLDLNVEIGQPDAALELLGNVDDPSLSTGPGSSAYRQGLVSALLGNYENAVALWEGVSIRQLRDVRTMGAINIGQSMIRGGLADVVRSFSEQSIPTQINTQAQWEYELGMILLESGAPEKAAQHLTTALELVPDMFLRPVIAYYLKKLGKPVPPPREGADGATPAPTTSPVSPSPTTASPSNPSPESTEPKGARSTTKGEESKGKDSDQPKAKADAPK